MNELWAATAATGATVINGHEWCHGNPQRRPLRAGVVGEIFTRFRGAPA